MALTIAFSQPSTVNTTEDIVFTGAVYDSGHSNWVLLGIRSPANVNQVQTSPDTTTWTIHAMPTTSAYRAIAYAPTLGAAGRLVAIGNGVAAWSDDGGATWAAATSLPSANSYWDVKWWPSQAIFVACASTGASRIATSTDGKSWTDRTAASALNWEGLEVSGSVAVCVAFLSGSTSTQLIQTSTDGTNWTLQTHTAIETRRGIVAGGGRLGIGYSADLDMFLITGNDGVNGTRAWRSTDDGVTWTASDAIPTIGDTTNRGFFWISGADSWYMSCANFNYGESTDAVTWTVTGTPGAITHGGYTPIHWDESEATFIGGSTLGFDTVMVGAVNISSVTSLSPSFGPSAGGTVVTIVGVALSGVTEVTFGGTAAVGIVATATTVTCITPEHIVGVVDVEVVGVGTLAQSFTFVEVTRVSPRAGTVAGGTAVTVTGYGFAGATSVLFGGIAATDVVVVSNTSITAVTPAHTSGAVDVEVVGVGTGTGLYTYTLPVPQNLGKGPLLPPIPTRRQP